MSARHTNVRLTIQKDYFASAAHLNEALTAISISASGINFALVPPAKIFTGAEQDVRCDTPLLDQVAAVVPFRLGLFGTEYNGDLVLCFGMACGGPSAKFYLARRPRLQNVSPPLAVTVVNNLAKQIQSVAREKLANQSFDFGLIGSLQNTSLTPLSAQTGSQTIAVNCLTAANIAGSDHNARFPEADVSISDWAHAVLQIMPSLFFDAMRASVRQQIANLPPLEFHEQSTDIVADPFPQGIPGNALRLSGDVACTNEFGDREDYGRHDIYSRLAYRTTTTPDEREIYFHSYATGRVFSPLVIVPLPDRSLTKIQNVNRLEVDIYQSLAEIRVKYKS